MLEDLERIRIWLEREAPDFAASLQPGISFAEMQRIMGEKAARWRIPDEVVELYGWRNGQAADVAFFHHMRFQPFEQAVAFAKMAEEYFSEGEFPLMVFMHVHANEAVGYVFKCEQTEQKLAPAYFWIYDGGGVEMPSLAELISAVAEGFEAGAFRTNDRGRFDTGEVWNAILIRRHRERMRVVNALRERRFGELTREELYDGFHNLAHSNHSETAPLIREYLQGGPGWSVGFEAFSVVLSHGFAIGDEWSRDYALSLISSEDSRVRSLAQSQLAWHWRGELRLRAEHVDSLIDQMKFSGQGDLDNRVRAMLLGVAGDTRAVPVLVQLLNTTNGYSDTRIAILKALGRLPTAGTRELCVGIAETDSEPGIRITAVRTLLEMGFEDSRVEAAAKKWVREILQRNGTMNGMPQPAVLQRWIEEEISQRG